MDELEEALVVLDGDLQRIDQVEDDVARLDLLNDRVERLDQAVSEYTGAEPGVSVRAPHVDRLTQDVEQLRGRLDALRSDFAEEARTQRIEIGAELKSLEGLIKDLSRELMAASPAFAAAAAEEVAGTSEIPLRLEERLERVNLAALDDEPDEEEAVDLLADETVVVTEETVLIVTEPASVADEPVSPVAEPFIAVAEPAFVAAPAETVLEDLREAIEANRIDLYLQPIVTLPDRKLRYYDASTRIRTGADDFMAAERLSPPGGARASDAAHRQCHAGEMRAAVAPRRRRLAAQGRVLQSLEPNRCATATSSPSSSSSWRRTARSPTASPSRSASAPCSISSADELAGLKRLGKLGFVFSLDHVADLDVDFAALRDHFFRYVKIEAKTLLHDLDEAGASVPAADMTRFLERFDLKLIAEKVDDEASLSRLIEYGADLAEGDLFGSPRPVTPEMFRELADADAA